MADLVLGISRTAVQLLADKVKSAIKEEAEQWKTVQRDLVFITGEFEMMQSFLDTASEERVRNQIVRTWVRQVRDLSYDVEDCIEFVLHLDTTKRSWWLRLLPSCSGGKTGAELPVDEAVAETTLLRARVVDVSQRNIRYNLIVDSASKPMVAMDPVQQRASATAGAISSDILINAVEKSGLLDLAGLITREDRDLQVVSICGTEGDLGKVAVIRKAYSDARIHKDFQCRAWVKLMHPFSPHEFLQSLMTQFFTNSCQEQEVNVGLDALERDLIKDFAQKEKNNKYLIFLEDLCTMVQWDAIRSYLPDRKKGSRIVVLTNHPVVACQCTGEPCRVSELDQFSPGHSVRVYYKEGFQHDIRVHSFMKAEPSRSLFNYGLLGRDGEMDELFKKTQESGLISVWGMPGVGKSALIEAIYGKLKTSNQFERYARVRIPHPFNRTVFSRRLLSDMHKESTSLDEDHGKALQAEDPIKECRDHLRECVCLFIIDGVQSNQDWDWINSILIKYGDSRSCILTISSEESVAKHCALSYIDGVYNVKGLQAAATVELFQKVLEKCGSYQVQWKDKEGRKTSVAREADLVLSKCGGLPKVIITVAEYLASKPRDVLEQEMRRLSDNFMHALATNQEFEYLRGLLAWMHSYLDSCPRHLKKFMLYLSIFPHDIIIRRRRLIRRWIAEGYSKGTDSNSTEKYVERIFDEVVALSIMQPVLQEATKVIGYRVNGFFREYILSRPVEETIFFPVEVSALEKQGHGRQVTGIGQHLAIGRTWETDLVLFQSLDLSRLRSMTLFDKTFLSLYVSDRMRVLRVLDLENARDLVDDDLEEIGKLPSRLKFLSLRGQRRITRLPDSVGDLVQLQTLDIRGSMIRTLPPFITKLRKLQTLDMRGTMIRTLPPFITKLSKLLYIRAGTTIAWTDDDISSSDGAEPGSTPSSGSMSRTLPFCLPKKFLTRGGPVVGSRSGGVEVPRGIKGLKALQTLGAVHVNTADAEAIMDEIHSLPQLKKLEVSGISRKQGRWYLYYIYFMTHLESLSLQFERNNHFVDWEFLLLPTSLRSLKMMGPVEQLPHNIHSAVNLGKLTLEMTNALLKADVLQQLGSLPSLRTLRLRVSKDEQHGELRFTSALFSKLQVLEIACKSKLDVCFDHGAMDKLEQLKVHCLQGSEMQFSGLEHPVSLKQVWLLGFFDDALKEALQQQLVEHPKIPPPKLMEVQREGDDDA